MNASDTIVVSPSNHLAADMGGEYVILGIKDERYYGVDGTGARVWELVQEPRTFAALVDTITGEFDVDREQCEKDIEAFLTDLESRSIVEVTRTGP